MKSKNLIARILGFPFRSSASTTVAARDQDHKAAKPKADSAMSAPADC